MNIIFCMTIIPDNNKIIANFDPQIIVDRKSGSRQTIIIPTSIFNGRDNEKLKKKCHSLVDDVFKHYTEFVEQYDK